ncbi:hypothetical protein K440DRAFT_635855 [Wilcoxina mikolae CBS 423.85]|nr:hypothetical protein K440DRAFT_635855 [Wilcoxina mikolae CBS 423.85]
MPARISFYRPTGQSRRSARQAHDHDVFEGLPVRRWHRDWVSVGKPAAAVSTPQPELPLPKDAHLMSSTSQGLLAAARAGSTSDETPKPLNPVQPELLFRTKRWVRIAKDMEPPEPVYLAKVPDAPGKKGEEMPINGGMGESIVPRRRAPPPPKKKHKRPGRKPGFKKQVTFVEGQQQQLQQQQQGQTVGEETVTVEGGNEVEMVDVDAATKMEPVPENPVAKEIEKAEEETEKATLMQKSEEGPSHALPGETINPPISEEVKTQEV